MAKKVTANGKTFTFDDNITNEQIGSVIDEYFSDIQKKNLVENVSTSGTQTSKRGFEPFQSQVDTKPIPYVKPKVKPKTISEAVEDDNNYLGAMYNQLIGAGSDFLGGMTRLIAKSNPYGNPIMKATADILGDKAEQVTEKLRSGSSSKKYEEEVQQGFDLTKGVFTKENAKALPLMISRFAGDMGLAIPTAGASYLAQGYSQGLKEFDRAVGNRTTDDPIGLDNAREIFGIAYSTISSVADRYSLGFMTKSNPVAKKVKEAILKETVQELATKTTGKITADVIEETASRIAKKGINKFKSVGLKGLASAGVEGGTEGITGLSTDILKGLTNIASNLGIFNEQEVVEDFWKNRINEIGGGAVLGGITGSALRGMKSVDDMVAERVSSATNKETLYEIASELKKELSDRYNDGSLDADRWNETGTNLGKYIKATEVIPFDIGAKKRKEAIQAIVERDNVAEVIKVKQEQMKASDESLAPQAQQEIDILEAKKQSLNDNIVEATADEKFKYSKDPEKDKWYKQLGEDGELQEISKQQYELETQSVPKEKVAEVVQPTEVEQIVEQPAEEVTVSEIEKPKSIKLNLSEEGLAKMEGVKENEVYPTRQFFKNESNNVGLPEPDSPQFDPFVSENKDNTKEETVDLSEITPTQELVDKAGIGGKLTKGNPHLVRFNDGLFVLDGHHRISTEAIKGNNKIKADVIAIDMTSNEWGSEKLNKYLSEQQSTNQEAHTKEVLSRKNIDKYLSDGWNKKEYVDSEIDNINNILSEQAKSKESKSKIPKIKSVRVGSESDFNNSPFNEENRKKAKFNWLVTFENGETYTMPPNTAMGNPYSAMLQAFLNEYHSVNKSKNYRDSVFGRAESFTQDFLLNYNPYESQIAQSATQETTKPQEDATQIRKIEQGNIPKREGVTEQQQGKQEDRNDKKEPIAESQTTPSNSNIVTESREKQEVEPEFTNQEDYDTYRIDKTEDLDELAFIHYNNQSEPDYKVEGVRDYIGSKGKINAKDYARYGDANNLTPEIKRRFIDSTNKSGSLDTQAMELSELLGIEVEPADFIDFVTDYSSMKGYEAKTKNKVQAKAEQRYYELTGKNLTPKRAEAGYLKIKNKPKTNEELYQLNEDLQEIGITYEDIETYQRYAEQESERIEEDLRKSESVGTTSTVDGKQDKSVQEPKAPALKDVESTAKALEVANKTKVERFYPDDKVILTTKDGKEVEVSFRGYNGENKAVIFGSRGSGINQMEVDVSQLRTKSKSDNLSKEDRKELLSKIDFQDKNAPPYSEDFTDKELQELSVKYPKENKLTNKEKNERNDLQIATTPLKRWQEQEYGVDNPNDPVNIRLAKEHETAINNIIANDKYSTLVSEAYHKAKLDGTNPELVKAVEDLLSEPKAEPKLTKIEELAQKRKEAKAKLDAINRNLGIAQDPKEKAKALFNYHKALVEEALAYIEAGVKTVQDFAKAIGEDVNDFVKDAWNEANGGKKKVESDFEETVDVLEEEELNVMGITKKEARRQREELGEEQYQYEVKSRAVLEEEATRLLEEGYSVPKLIKRINKDPKSSDVEIELLRRYFTSLTARINKKPTPELLQERKDLMSALDLLKTSAGRTVQAFDGLIAIEDNLASYLEEESKYADLSEKEIQDLTEKYNKAKEALDKYEELERKAAEEALNKKLQSEINKTKKTRAEIKGDFRQKRQQYVTDARAELKKIRNSYSAVIVPYQRELIALAPFAKKMAQSYAEEGIYELKEIVKGIRDEFINDIPELTELDVKMMLAGQYPNTRKTRNAKLAKIRDLEMQAKLEIKIEELEKGIIQTPNPVKKRVKSERVEALEKEIALIKKRNPDLTYPSKIQARKTFYKNRIKELQKEIESGEFDVIEAPIPIVLDDETLRLKDEFIKFKEETRIRREKKEHEALSEFEKKLGVLRELAEIKRIVQTSIDVSIPMRQGVSVMFNPRTTKLGVEAYGKMLNTMFSEKKYNRLMYDIENNPEFLRSKDDGIVYTDLGSNNIELRDESHPIKGFIQRIPILGKGIKISARAAAAWTNYARFQLYQRQVRFLKAQGKTRENAKEAYEQAAARVMTDTGRGKLPILSDKVPSREGTVIKQSLGTVFYGARLYSSTFRKLNPFYYLNPKVDTTVRVEALKDMIGYVASQIIVTTAVAALLGASVSLDYDEPDFMKIRIGKRVIDLTAGQGVYIRTFLRLIHAAYNRFDPTINEKDANKYAQFAIQSVGTFWRNKLAPNTSYLYSAFSGKNSIGEKFDPYEIIKIYPMYTDDIITAFKEGSPLDALFILPVGLSGIGYQEYSKDIRRARVNNYVKDKDLLLFLKSKKLNIQGDINQEVYDLETNEQVKMTKEQSDKYEKVWSEYIIDRIKAEKKDLDKLSEEELDKEITKLKSSATKVAKEAISGITPDMLTIEDKGTTYQLTIDQIKEFDRLVDKAKTRRPDLTPSRKKAIMEANSELEKDMLKRKFSLSDAMEESKKYMLKKYKGKLIEKN